MGRGTDGPVARAAIDIGSYSVHVLVAEVGEDGLVQRHDESAFLGLGRTIDETGRLGEARTALRDTIAGFAAAAAANGAISVSVVGTDPLRRAPDARDAIAEIHAATGIDVVVLSHEEEAMLALLGVQEGRVVTRPTVMVDVGGGSTEILMAGPDLPTTAVGLPLGATRLSGRHVQHDPPTEEELGALHRDVAETMDYAPDFVPERLVAVGGTARSLLRVGPPLANRVLSLSRIQNALDLLATDPAATIAERHGVRLSRAKVLAAGATILMGALDRYGLDRLRVGEGGLREGLILAVHHGGDDWRERLPALAQGWREDSASV